MFLVLIATDYQNIPLLTHCGYEVFLWYVFFNLRMLYSIILHCFPSGQAGNMTEFFTFHPKIKSALFVDNVLSHTCLFVWKTTAHRSDSRISFYYPLQVKDVGTTLILRSIFLYRTFVGNGVLVIFVLIRFRWLAGNKAGASSDFSYCSEIVF